MEILSSTYPLPGLLDAELEQLLGRQIEAGLLASAVLDGTSAELVSAGQDELQALVEQGRQAWHHFLEANVGLVAQQARRAAATHDVDADEYFQEGMVALAEALRRWDHRLGLRFSTYALPWVRNAITLHIARRGGRVEGPTNRPRLARRLREDRATLEARLARSLTDAEFAEFVGVGLTELQLLLACGVHASLDDMALEPAAPDDPGQVVERAEPWWVGQLPSREAMLLRLRFGLGDDIPRTREQVARAMGLSPSSTGRLERKALLRARRMIERHGLEAA